MPRTSQTTQTGGCRRACKQCTPITGQCCFDPHSCPSKPIVKEFHQGIVMSGAGKPPHTEGGVDYPEPRCFLYGTWYDFAANVLYKERTDLSGKAIGYDAFENGDQLLLQYRITDPTNPGVLGSVLTSESILSLQRCINADAARLAPTGSRNSLTNTAAVLNCAIKKANKGSIGFIYGNPPIPVVLEQLQNGAGYTTTPDYWLVPGALPDGTPANGFQDFGWIVFVRDKRNNKYYRDTFNSPLNDPEFPPNAGNPEKPCDGDVHMDDRFQLFYQFDADTCRWYLLNGSDDVIDALDQLDAINVGLETTLGTCEIDPCWRRNCNCNCAPRSDCCSETSARSIEPAEPAAAAAPGRDSRTKSTTSRIVKALI